MSTQMMQAAVTGGHAGAEPMAAVEIEANQSYVAFEGPQRYRGFPVRFAIPAPQGKYARSETLTLREAGGAALPAVVRPFVFWPDGSVRGWDVVMPLNLGRGKKVNLQVQVGKEGPAPAAGRAVSAPGRAVVAMTLQDGSVLTAEVRLGAPSSSEAVTRTEFPFVLTKPGSAMPLFRGVLVRHAWQWYGGTEWECKVTNYGPEDTQTIRGLRLTLELPGQGTARYVARQTAYTAAGHPKLAAHVRALDVRADPGIHVTDAVQIDEDENRYPPYERGGYVLALAPWLGRTDDTGAWVLVVPEASERAPKGWRFTEQGVVIELFPEESGTLEWRQGMTLFQRVVLVHMPGSGATSVEEMESKAQAWLRPPVVRIDAEVYRRAGWRLPFPFQPERFPRTEFHFRDSFNFSWTPGTFNYGDQVAGGKGGGSVSPGGRGVGRNLEYDFVAVAAKEYARTGVGNIWKLCRSSAEHMMYTDFVAHSSDQWKHGGICHHCPDHTNGSAYPSHMWAEGLTLYYQLSADPAVRECFMRVGDFYLKYIHERFGVVQSTAREVGWTLIALAAIYDVTREARYFEGIQKVVDYNLGQGWRNFFPTDACFTVGVAIIGLDRTRHFHRDAETRKFIIELCDWMMNERRDGIGLFEYWKDPEQGAIPYIQTHQPEALNIGYKLTGDEKHLRAAYRLYQIHLGGGLLTVQNRGGPPECGYAAGNYISWIGCLQSFAEKGWLERLQYIEP